MPTNIDKNKLNLLIRNPRLSTTDKTLIKDASKNISELEMQIKKLENTLNSENLLLKNPKVKKLIEKEASKAKSTETTVLQKNIRSLQATLNSENKLKTLPSVKRLIEKEKSKEVKIYQLKLDKLDKALILKDSKISELTNLINLTRTKPVNNKEFNNFISHSVTELQKSFTQATLGSETDILIRDVEIEARVITEMKNNKPVFIIPSRVDMKELGSENFQKLKYSLSIVPKDI
jgi:DNA-directed RNA polymerase subunit M/transcription elongation factor TFIIS